MNRRCQYRVTPQIAQSLDVALYHEGKKMEPAHLSDISAGGAAVEIPDQFSDLVRRDGRIVVRITASGRPPLDISGIVRSRMEGEGTLRLGIQFDAWGDVRQQIHPRLRRIFNEREAYRVEPAAGSDVKVDFLQENGETFDFGDDYDVKRIRGQMYDLSVLGIGVKVKRTACEFLLARHRYALVFDLPGEPETLKLVAKVVHVTKRGSQAMIGMQFHEHLTESHLPVERFVGDYVISRQLVGLQGPARSVNP